VIGRLTVVVAFCALLLVVGLSAPGLPGAGAAGMRQCRDVVIRNPTGGIYTQTEGLFARGVSCRRARQVAHAVMVDDGESTPQPHGFHCAIRSDGTGVGCRRGGKRVSWRYALSRSNRRARPVPKVECLVDGVGQTYKIAPKDCVMYEHGSPATTILASMKWRNWGKKRARGRGEIHYYDHPEYTGRVVVTLSRIAKGYCVPGRYYTRARIRAVSGRSKGNDFTLNLAAGCPA
jgi:hypothetical protein